MDNPCTTPRPVTAGELTTFYSYQSGPARSLVLANMAWLLAGRQHDTVPVLMVDWDLESPGLHYLFGAGSDRPGLLELLEACRVRHDGLTQAAAAAGRLADPDDTARAVLGAVDWPSYVERVDTDRPLYLLRAGRFDCNYGERAAQFDWQALYLACPALLRQFRLQLAQAFRHVFIDARCGRSAAVSICTALLPDKIVGLFTPHPASLDGLCATVQRAIAYRCSHEEEQRPLLLYPLPCAPTGTDFAQQLQWRRGAAGHAHGGYQHQLEALMGAIYGRTHVSLERYCNDILLYTDTLFRYTDAGGAVACNPDHVPPAQTLAALLDWLHGGYFPWQNQDEHMYARGAARPHAGEPNPRHDHPPAHDRPQLDRYDAISARQDGAVQFPALRHLGPLLGGSALVKAEAMGSARAARSVEPALSARHHALDANHMRQLADAVEVQLDQLQQLVDRQALREARPLADTLRHLVLRPAVAFALRRRGAALIKLVYHHDNDTDALLAFAQDELAALERALNDAAAGRPLAYS